MDRRFTVDFSLKTIFIFAASLIAIWLVYFLRDILVLFLLAFILATALEPTVNFFQKKHIPRWITILGIYSLIAFVIYTFVRLIIPPIAVQIESLIANRQGIAESLTGYFSNLPVTARTSIMETINSLPSRFGDSSGAIVNNALGVFSGLFGFLTVLVVTFYLLMEKGALEKAILELWPVKSQQKALKVVNRIIEKISLWARGQMILSTAIGLLTYIGLAILGVEYAPTLSLFAAFTEFIPYVGPFISTAFAVILAFSISPLTALWVAILYFGIQQFEGSILVPQVMKRTLGISPVLIIFSLLVGAKLLGFIGIIIAIPVASAISVLIEAYNKKEV